MYKATSKRLTCRNCKYYRRCSAIDKSRMEPCTKFKSREGNGNEGIIGGLMIGAFLIWGIFF